MIKKERQEKILALVKAKGYASLEEVERFLSISESTVRRDIVEMDKQGLLMRERGGASSLRTNSFPLIDQKLIVRERIETESKVRIAKAALGMIKPDSTIYLDAGSSTLMFAKLLSRDLRIAVVTNSLTIATTVSEKEISTFLVGGSLKVTTDATVGPMAEEALSRFHFRQAFMGANAVDPDLGFMTPDVSEASLKRKAVESCDEAVFLVDRTKFDSKSVVSFSPLEGRVAVTDYVDSKNRYERLSIVEVN